MLWRYAEKHTTDTQSAEGVRAVQASRLADILVLLEEEINGKRFLLGDEVRACDHFLFMLALWCEKLPRPPSAFVYRMQFMREMSKRQAVQIVSKIEGVDVSLY